MNHYPRRPNGFTLIELLVVVSIIGILAGLGIQTFRGYRAKAAYSMVQATLRDARTALEGGRADVDVSRAAVPLTVLASPGKPSDPAVAAVLPGFVQGKSMKTRISFDPACADASCTAVTLQANHCAGEAYSLFTEYGDGSRVSVERVPGSGCP